ncbi:MAG: hypothetical protein HWD59_03660 [Coxiellaceae bacterium]|nr:MAG: hypothetical protein HWD59_03660 [Coxiellaceae bacterium]
MGEKAKAAANQFLIMRQNLLEFINQYYSLNQIQQNYWRDVICQVQKPWQRFILQQATRQLDVVIIQVAKCQIAIAQFDLSEICTSLLAIHNIVEQDPQKIQRFSTSLDQIDNAQLMLFVQSFLAEMKEYKDSIEDILFLIKKACRTLGKRTTAIV